MTIPVAPGAPLGGLITGPLQVQYGDMLLGASTSAGWRNLVGWRDTPAAQVSDTPRPQAHGTYPGDVFGDSLTVTLTYLVRGTKGDPLAKLRDLQTIEANTRMDGVERPLIVHDGLDATMRMGRIIGRQVPMDKGYGVGPVECSAQWVCSDPRRYSLAELGASIPLATAEGGLEYPLAYPLDYGEATGGSRSMTNEGSANAPLVVTFRGPLTNPVLSSTAGWRLAFRLTISEGEFLVVDTRDGTAQLNGNADRLYTIDALSSPLEQCVLPPGTSSVNLAAPNGAGFADVAYRHAYL